MWNTESYLGIQQCMNQEKRWMEDSIYNEQRAIQTKSNVFWIIQLAENVPKNNEQHIQRTSTWRNVGKLYG